MRQRIRIVAAVLFVAAIAVAAPAGAERRAAGSQDVRTRPAGRGASDAGAPGPARRAGLQTVGPRTPAARKASVDATPRSGVRTPTTDGLDADLLGTGNVATSPADPTGATGPTRVVAAVNVSVAVYDRTGAELMAPVRLRNISSALTGLQETDPKVFYDAYDDVFVLAFLTYDANQGYIDVVTIPSATAEDRGTWCMTTMVGDQVKNGQHEFADYPTLGFTTNRVVVTTNNFGFNDGPFRYAQIVSMPKTQLYDDPTCTKTVHIEVAGGNATKNPDGSKAFTLQAATAAGGSPTDQFLVSLEPRSAAANLVLWRLRVGGGTMTVDKTAEAVTHASPPPLGYQCNSTNDPDTWWDTGDLRITSAFYDGGTNRLYAATAVQGVASGAVVSAIRWYEAEPKGRFHASSVLREGTVKAAARDAAWPALATNDAGTLFLTYARAGMPECLSMYAATVPAATTTATGALVAAGTARYDFKKGVERWGDFSAANRDPVTPADVAVVGAFAESDGMGPTTLFREHIALLADV
jgi:hypothetical protein